MSRTRASRTDGPVTVIATQSGFDETNQQRKSGEVFTVSRATYDRAHADGRQSWFRTCTPDAVVQDTTVEYCEPEE